MNSLPCAGTSLNSATREFLGGTAWSGAACAPLTGDASARRYFRLRQHDQSAILMDASQNLDSVAPFIQIAQHLHRLGFSVPAILARAESQGLLLLEDFGDGTFVRLLENPENTERLYALATDVLIALHEHPQAAAVGSSTDQWQDRSLAPRGTSGEKVGERGETSLPHASSPRPSPPLHGGEGETSRDFSGSGANSMSVLPQAVPPGLRVYHAAKMLEDIELFLEWKTPDISEAGQAEFRAAWQEILPRAHLGPASLLLRDYHVANLMFLPNRDGVRQAGLLDFQDAYQGPVTYDLMSLLEDARRDVPEAVREKMLARYLAHFPALDRDAFATSMAILAALRHTRVLAIFERLSRRDGKHDYRQLHSPRVERMLQTALLHPMLARAKRWFDSYAR